MANRDKSTETKNESTEAVVAPAATSKFFPTSLDCGRAMRAAGKVRPNQPSSIDELIEVAESLKAGRKG